MPRPPVTKKVLYTSTESDTVWNSASEKHSSYPRGIHSLPGKLWEQRNHHGNMTRTSTVCQTDCMAWITKCWPWSQTTWVWIPALPCISMWSWISYLCSLWLSLLIYNESITKSPPRVIVRIIWVVTSKVLSSHPTDVNYYLEQGHSSKQAPGLCGWAVRQGTISNVAAQLSETQWSENPFILFLCNPRARVLVCPSWPVMGPRSGKICIFRVKAWGRRGHFSGKWHVA